MNEEEGRKEKKKKRKKKNSFASVDPRMEAEGKWWAEAEHNGKDQDARGQQKKARCESMRSNRYHV